MSDRKQNQMPETRTHYGQSTGQGKDVDDLSRIYRFKPHYEDI